MKKIAILILVVLLAATVAPGFAAGPVYDELPDLEGAEIVFGVENFYTPFQFVDSRGGDEGIGFEYDLVAEVCNRINCVPVYELSSFPAQLEQVANGEFDATMNGLFITEERQAQFDMTIPYLESGTFLLARAGEDRFANIDEFVANAESENLIAGVQTGSFGETIIREFNATPEGQIQAYDDFNVMLVALANGDIDTMVVDAFAGEFVAVGAENFELVGDRLVDPLPYGLVFQQGSEYTEAFNAAIQSMLDDGYIDFLYHKWSVDFQPLGE